MKPMDGMIPPPGLTRRLSMQAALFAVGYGAFLTGNAVFFTQIVGLTAAQVGLGLTIAGAAAAATATPLGRAADRLGAQRMWAGAAFVEGALYFAYPWIHGFGSYVAVVVALQLAGSAGMAARGAFTLNMLPVEHLAYLRSALNLGITVGAGAAGLALAVGDRAGIRLLPVGTSALLLLNAVLIARLRAAPRAADEKAGNVAEAADPADTARPVVSVLRNRAFLALQVLVGVLNTHQVLLNVVIPLWLVQRTDAPHWLLAWLLATNTILVVLLQVAAARRTDTVRGSLRALRRSALCLAVSCPVLMLTDSTAGWVTVALIWLGHVVLTGSELYSAAGSWGLTAKLSEPGRRGEYQGVVQLGNTLGSVWAPAVFTFLATDWRDAGWILIAVVALAASAAAGPATRAAQHWTERTASPEQAMMPLSR